MAKLTPKQEKFCQEYVSGETGTQAYFKAYNCTIKAAESGASENLRKPKIEARIKELRERVTKKTMITVASVVRDIADTHRRAKNDNDFNAELKAEDMLMKHVGGYQANNEQIGKSVTDILAAVAGS